MKDEENIIKNKTEVNNAEKEVVSGTLNNRLHESVEEIEDVIDSVEDTNQKIESLLDDNNLSEEERKEYRREFDLIKKDTLNFKDRLKKLGERVLEGVAKGINSTIESYSDRFGENRKKIKTVEFVLDNLDIENKEELRVEFEKRKNEHDLWGIDIARFPLNDEGLKVLKIVFEKISVKNFYNIESCITIANKIFDLNKKGVSLDFIESIRIQDMEHGDFDYDIIEKMKILSKSDISCFIHDIYLYSIKNLDIKVATLIRDNDLSFEGLYHLESDDLNEYLNKDNLNKVNLFLENKKINISDFIILTRYIFALPDEVQSLCQRLINKKILPIPRIINRYDDKKIWFLKNLNDKQISVLTELFKRFILSSFDGSDIEKYAELEYCVFDRMKELGLSDGDMMAYNIDKFVEISKMSDEEFSLFSRVYRSDRGLKSSLEICKKLIGVFDVEESNLVLELIIKTREIQNFRYYLVGDYDISHFKPIINLFKGPNSAYKLDITTRIFGPDFMFDLIHENQSSEFINYFLNNLENNPDNLKKSVLSVYREKIVHMFKNFGDIERILSDMGIYIKDDQKQLLLNEVLNYRPDLLTEEHSFEQTLDQKRLSMNKIIDVETRKTLSNFKFVDKIYLNSFSNSEKREYLDQLFDRAMQSCPLDLLNSKDFPFTPEQQRYIDLFKIITESQSAELKNLSDQIIPMLAKYRDIEDAKKVLGGIEQIFLSNNIPLVGKQYKVFELMYGDKELDFGVNRSKVESLKNVKDNSKRRLMIFKDLLRSHIASCDENLYSYLQFLSENRSVILRFQSGESVSEEERQKIKFFIKKINVLSGHIGRYSVEIEDNLSDNTLRSELESIAQAFGVKEGSDIISRFEQAFLKRVGIDSVEQAMQQMDEYKQNAHQRNILNSSQGVITVKPGDMIKGVASGFIDTYLDKGVYSPEFIGAETHQAKQGAKSSDQTPFDTDLSIFEGEILKDGFTGYGDMYFIIKQKEQLERDQLDIFKTGVVNNRHYGIRTGFGSTNIDAICVDGEKSENIKYFIAQKGFYIPICDAEGKVTFTLDDFNRYKKTFAGTHKSKGAISLSDEWKKHTEISESKQTEGNIESITRVKDKLIDKIKSLLEENNILFHKGEYDDSLLGAIITDTGSTGRGSALDEKFDFDFAVKLDDKDWDKVGELIKGLESLFESDDSYENQGMRMFRSKELEVDGHKMTVDIGFVKKSDSESFDAHDALHEKYNSIEEIYGKDKLLDVLTNIRYAKKKLKEAGCYKKGLGDNGQQGGLGGIGVEYWILQNGGDAIKAFRDFAEVAYDNGQLISFEDFKKKYKIFSAGQNIRGGIKVENFVYNMAPEGYEKMSRLALELTQ